MCTKIRVSKKHMQLKYFWITFIFCIWSSSTLTTCCKGLTHWTRLWCGEGLGAGGEGDDRGWDGWMASWTWWTWVWVNSGRWWWTGRPGVLRFMGLQRVGHDWVTELNWFCIFITMSMQSTFWLIFSPLIFKYIICLIYNGK